MPIVADSILAFKILFEILFKTNTVLPTGLVDLVRGLSTAIRIHECLPDVEQQSVCVQPVQALPVLSGACLSLTYVLTLLHCSGHHHQERAACVWCVHPFDFDVFVVVVF